MRAASVSQSAALEGAHICGCCLNRRPCACPQIERAGLAPVPVVREQAVSYDTDGCDYHATCLTCPLSQCRWDHPGGLFAVLEEARKMREHHKRMNPILIEGHPIILRVAKETGVPIEEIQGLSRAKPVAAARFRAMVRLRDAGYALKNIGYLLGRDHTTIISGIRRGREIMSRDAV